MSALSARTGRCGRDEASGRAPGVRQPVVDRRVRRLHPAVVAFPRFRAPVAVVTASYPAALPPRMRAIEAQARPAAASHAAETEPREADTLLFQLAG